MPRTIAASRQVPADYLSVVLPADVTVNLSLGNQITDVTGLSFAVVAGATYIFRFMVTYTSGSALNGSRWSINGPAITSLTYRSEYTLTATTRTTNDGLTAYDLPAASHATSLTAGNIAIVEGVIKPSASGTLTLRVAAELALTAITAKGGLSWVEYKQIA